MVVKARMTEPGDLEAMAARDVAFRNGNEPHLQRREQILECDARERGEPFAGSCFSGLIAVLSATRGALIRRRGWRSYRLPHPTGFRQVGLPWFTISAEGRTGAARHSWSSRAAIGGSCRRGDLVAAGV